MPASGGSTDAARGRAHLAKVPVTVTVLFVLLTWLLVRNPGEPHRNCVGSTKQLTERNGEKGWVYVAPTDFFEETPEQLPAFACGMYDRRSEARLAQVKLLRMMPRFALFLRAVNATYWIDKDNLESITQHTVAGGEGRFHPLDYDLQIGMFTEDAQRVYKAIRRGVDIPVDEIYSNLTIAELPALFEGGSHKKMNYTYAWGVKSALLLFNKQAVELANLTFTGTAMKLVDWSTGSAIVVTAYARDPATKEILSAPLKAAAPPMRITEENLLPLGTCIMYDLEYPCPAAPLSYLQDLAGLSWVARPKRSKVKWIFVAILFFTLASYVVKKT